MPKTININYSGTSRERVHDFAVTILWFSMEWAHFMGGQFVLIHFPQSTDNSCHRLNICGYRRELGIFDLPPTRELKCPGSTTEQTSVKIIAMIVDVLRGKTLLIIQY